MDKKDQQLAGQIRDLPWDDAPDAAHRNRLKADLLQAWVTRPAPEQGASRWHTLTRKGRAIMTSRITRHSTTAAALILILVGLSYLPGSPHPISQPAWAIEQSIAAMADVRTVYIAGVGGIGEPLPFEFWAQRDAKTNQMSFRFECPDEVCLFLDGVGYHYSSGSKTVTQFNGMDFGNVKYLAAAMQMQLWLRGEALANLKQESQDWKEVYGHDEQTHRPCVFVTCSCAALGGAFWFQFDLETKLPVHLKMWFARGESKALDTEHLVQNESPTADMRTIVVNEPIPQDRLEFRLPEGMTVADGRAIVEQRKADDLYEAHRFRDAIAIYENVPDLQPGSKHAQQALMMIGICYDWLKEYDKAVQALERAVRENSGPSRPLASTYYYLGNDYCEVGRKEDALRAFIQSAQLSDEIGHHDDWPGQDARESIANLQVKLFGEDAPDWANAVDVTLERQRVLLWHKAESYRKAGQFQDALDCYQQSIRLYSPKVYRTTCAGPLVIGQCQEGLGQRDLAIQSYKKCIEQCKATGNVDSWADKEAKARLARLQQDQQEGLLAPTSQITG